jgi:FkbM family methyltransferase
MITGIGVHDPPEFAFTINWNSCSRSTGFSVHSPPEHAIQDLRELLLLLFAVAEESIKSATNAGTCPPSRRFRRMDGKELRQKAMAGAIAARVVGITSSRLYGVEADPEHVASMRQHFLDNDLDPSGHVLLQAAVGPETGVARWPRYPDARNMWGARPLRHGSREDEDYPNPATRNFIEIEIMKASELLLREPLWDMLHIDIQGWEGAVCGSCIDQMTERVRWVILGVHSRILDADLLRLFHGAGWILEHEKPTQFRFAPEKASFESMVIADGTQIWRNPRMVS